MINYPTLNVGVIFEVVLTNLSILSTLFVELTMLPITKYNELTLFCHYWLQFIVLIRHLHL